MQVLPDTQTLATLDPHSLHIELTGESRQSLADSLAYRTDSRAAELYAHESQHFYDLVGTVWGQDYLDRLFTAYDAILTQPGSEANYPVVLSLFDTDRTILFPSYYKYVMAAASHGTATNRWRMSMSSGVRIEPDGTSNEDRPILFVRFDQDRAHVARQPVTVGALLELRATGTEIGVWSRWNQTRPPDEQVVNEALRSRDILGYHYDPELTTYSVAAHIAGQFLGDSEVIGMVDAGFKIAEIALNLTSNAFGKLKPDEALFGPLGHRRLRGFKAQRDRGFAYALLMWNLRGFSGGLVDDAAIEMALARSRLKALDDLHDAARTAVARKGNSNLRHPDLRLIRERLVEVGLKIMMRRDFSVLALYPPPPTLPAPVVMTGLDCEEFHVGPPALNIDQTGFLHDCYLNLREATRLALRAGRGLEFAFTDYVY